MTKPFFKPLKGVPYTCSVCGRLLKDPKSIAMGIGPVCLSKAGVKKIRRTVIHSTVIPRLFDLEEITYVEENRDRKLPKS